MQEELKKAMQALYEGKVVAHPTETCYGLAADIFQRAAIQRLYSLKKMSVEKPVSILVRDLQEAEQYGEFSEKAKELARKFWPGPLTIVVPRKMALPVWVNFGQMTVGFRVSSNKRARALLEAFGGPVTTTSANISGQPEAYTVEDFLKQGLQPDFVWDVGKIGPTPPSTLVSVIGEEVKLLRQGSVKVPEAL